MSPEPSHTGQATPAGGSLAWSWDDDGFDHLDPEWLASKPGVKWGGTAHGTIAAWVADMDFPAPPVIRAALEALARQADLGYAHGWASQRLAAPFCERMATRFGWQPEPYRVRAFTDLVQATQAVLHVGTEPGDGVLLLTPSYPPFVRSIEEMGRKMLAVPVRPGNDGCHEVDLDAASRLAPSARALLMVNPHNPTGHILAERELAALAELAERYNLAVVSDEIHADLVLDTGRHVPFASLGGTAASLAVTLYSASKSFNVGGMSCAVAHVAHDGVRSALEALPDHLLGSVGTAAVATTLAAWSPEGDAWLDRCLVRLRDNRSILGDWLNGEGGEVCVRGVLPEATYLAWLDFREAPLGDDPASWLEEHAKVRLSPGPDFGPGGAGHARLNFATTPEVLQEMLARIFDALAQRKPSRWD